uniref:Uncharacterized protein n=1 Tax=Knipowitschia caucasica TaxID=637954 RepID=A0AAV2MNG0_KNICA
MGKIPVREPQHMLLLRCRYGGVVMLPMQARLLSPRGKDKLQTSDPPGAPRPRELEKSLDVLPPSESNYRCTTPHCRQVGPQVVFLFARW